MKIKHVPPIIYILFLIVWQWWVFSEQFPGEWYRSLATGLFDLILIFLYFVLSNICTLCLEHMSGRKARLVMKTIEIQFIAFSIFFLYKGLDGDRVRLQNESIESLFLMLTIIGYLLTKETFYRMLKGPLLGGLNGVSVLDEVRLFKYGKFQEVRACIVMALSASFFFIVWFVKVGWRLFTT